MFGVLLTHTSSLKDPRIDMYVKTREERGKWEKERRDGGIITVIRPLKSLFWSHPEVLDEEEIFDLLKYLIGVCVLDIFYFDCKV